MTTVGEFGWPYVHHCGGKQGFLHAINPSSSASADLRGNRQLLSTGNLAANDCVCLFLMDYQRPTRLDILGHALVADARNHTKLHKKYATSDVARIVERVFLIQVISYAWNCQQ